MKWNLIFLLALVFASCSEQDVNDPLNDDLPLSGQVSDIKVENLPGKAKISYVLPKDQDLLYVKADYFLESGKKMSVKSSYYKNSVLLEGFSGNMDVDVSITTVNRSEKESEPVTVTVSPEPAPIFDVFETLGIEPAFGGVYVSAENPKREDLAILIMQKDELGDWVPLTNSIYTSTEEIKSTLRGMDTIPKDFALTIRDRWLNYTDTLFVNIKPFFEEAIPTSGYRGLRLPNDAPFYDANSLDFLWDKNFLDWPRVYLTLPQYTENNHMLTFSLGVNAKLSRIVIWDYPEYGPSGRIYYNLGCPKRFRIYGSDVLDTSGDLSSWTLLGEYEETKPSGLPYGQQNNEDYQTARAGFSWEIPIEMPAVKYIRIENLVNWAGGKQIALAELQAYGQVQN